MYAYVQRVQYVLLFIDSTDNKFELVLNFTELHALTQATVLMRSCLIMHVHGASLLSRIGVKLA